MAASPHALDLAQLAAEAAEDKLAVDIVALDVTDHFPLSDVFVVASAPNERQVSAIVDAVEARLREAGAKPLRREGERDARWILIDFGDIVVHIQHAEERTFYQLEKLWKDCPPLALRLGHPDTVGAVAGAGVSTDDTSV